VKQNIIKTRIDCDCCHKTIMHEGETGANIFFSDFKFDICPKCSIEVLHYLISQRVIKEAEFNEAVEQFSLLSHK